jgi:hypothetical protein
MLSNRGYEDITAPLNSLGAQIETFRDIWDSAFHLSPRLGVDDCQRV